MYSTRKLSIVTSPSQSQDGARRWWGQPKRRSAKEKRERRVIIYQVGHPSKQHQGGSRPVLILPHHQGGAQHSQKFLETEEWPRWRLWWPSFGSGMGASEREGHWRLAILCFCKKFPLSFHFFVKAKVFWPLSVSFCTNMCSSWKGSDWIESTRQICSVSTSKIKAENEQFDHEDNKHNATKAG